jgi:hypothetical protein
LTKILVFEEKKILACTEEGFTNSSLEEKIPFQRHKQVAKSLTDTSPSMMFFYENTIGEMIKIKDRLVQSIIVFPEDKESLILLKKELDRTLDRLIKEAKDPEGT